MTARHRGAGPLGHGDGPGLPPTVVFIPPVTATPPAWGWLPADVAGDHPDPRLGCATRPGPGEAPSPAGPDDPDPGSDRVADDGPACGLPRAVSAAVLTLLAGGTALAAIAAAIASIAGSR